MFVAHGRFQIEVIPSIIHQPRILESTVSTLRLTHLTHWLLSVCFVIMTIHGSTTHFAYRLNCLIKSGWVVD